MKPMEIKEGIYWLGVIDWNIRDFHGYSTYQGTTYNSYLIMDEKITLIDAVKKNSPMNCYPISARLLTQRRLITLSATTPRWTIPAACRE